MQYKSHAKTIKGSYKMMIWKENVELCIFFMFCSNHHWKFLLFQIIILFFTFFIHHFYKKKFYKCFCGLSFMRHFLVHISHRVSSQYALYHMRIFVNEPSMISGINEKSTGVSLSFFFSRMYMAPFMGSCFVFLYLLKEEGVSYGIRRLLPDAKSYANR